MRLFLAVSVFLVATLFFIVGIFLYSTSGSKSSIESIQKTIDKNIVIDKALRKSASYVDDFYRKNQRYPSSSEFESWAVQQPKTFYHPKNIRILSDINNYPSEVLDRFGKPADNSYILSLWRGEWSEYYISWENKTTLSFDVKDYEFPFVAFLFIMLVSLCMFLLSALLASRRLQEKIKSAIARLVRSDLSPSTYKNIGKISNHSKQYIKVLLGWFSVGILLGLLTAVGGGVGPGSYLIWLGIIIISIVFSVIHCIAILGYNLCKSR